LIFSHLPEQSTFALSAEVCRICSTGGGPTRAVYATARTGEVTGVARPLLYQAALRPFTRWVLSLFVSPLGVVVLAALDSTVFLSLPFGIDAAVILLAARLRALAWIVPLLATAGSLAGAWLTFWMGRTIGDSRLHRYIRARRLAKVRARVRRSGAIALAVLDLVPPPFPFTAFVLAAGALHVRTKTFFVTLAICRIIRFGGESALAVIYGRRILVWVESDLFHDIATGFIVIGIALMLVSIVRLIKPDSAVRKRTAA